MIAYILNKQQVSHPIDRPRVTVSGCEHTNEVYRESSFVQVVQLVESKKKRSRMQQIKEATTYTLVQRKKQLNQSTNSRIELRCRYSKLQQKKCKTKKMFSILCNLLQNKVYLKTIDGEESNQSKKGKPIHSGCFVYAGESNQTYERFKFRTVTKKRRSYF